MASTSAEECKTVFVFPGQGSQKKGMLAELHASRKVVRETFEHASDTLGYSMAKLCLEDPEGQLSLTEYTQPALLAASTALWRLLKSELGASAAEFHTGAPTVAGHSLGEYSALVALGVLDFAEALRLVQIRGRAMQAAVPVGLGAMSAFVGDHTHHADALCQESSDTQHRVEVANENSPAQVVVSGHAQAVERFGAFVKERKLGRALPLPVSAPFHSSLMAPAAAIMAEALSKASFHKTNGTIVANVDAAAYSASVYGPDLLVKQVTQRVKWTSTTRQFLKHLDSPAAADSKARFIEVGPGTVLQGLLRKTIPQEHQHWVEKDNLSILGSDSLESFDKLLETLARSN
jgi:[acyl-carrier-protein] S-malonyltransferase